MSPDSLAHAAADHGLALAREYWACDPGNASAATKRDAAIGALRDAAALLGQETQRDLDVEVSLGGLLNERWRSAGGADDWREAVTLLSAAMPALLDGPAANLGFAAAVAGHLGEALAEYLCVQSDAALADTALADDTAVLDAAIHWLGLAVELAGAGASPPEHIGATRRQLANLLRLRFMTTGSRDDIEHALTHIRAALAAIPPRTPQGAEVQRELVEICFCRLGTTPGDADIDDLIETGRAALAAVATSAEEHALIAAITGVVMACGTRQPSRQSRLERERDAAIDLLREAYADLPADSGWRPAVTREYGALVLDRAGDRLDQAALLDSIALLTEAVGLLAGDPAQTETAVALGSAIVRAASLGRPEADLDVAVGLLTGTHSGSITDPGRLGLWLDATGLALTLRARRRGNLADLDRGIDYHARAVGTYPHLHPGYVLATINLATALLARYGQRGDLSDLDVAAGHLDQLIAGLTPGSPQWRDARMARAECVMSRPPDRQDPAEFDAALALSRQPTEALQDSDPLRPQFLHNLIVALLLRFGRNQDPADAAQAAELAVTLADGLPADHAERAELLTSAAVAVWAGGAPAGLADPRARSIAYLSEAVAASAPDDPQRGRRLAALGISILTPPGHRAADPLSMLVGRVNTGELDQAIGYLDEAAALLAQVPGSQMSALLLLTVARLRRSRADPGRDDNARARTDGLAALAEHGLGVFLQSNTPNALIRARAVAADAAEVAAWCLADGAAAQAVTALESGRGLVLHAATATVGVAESLRKAGQDTLAREWSRAAQDLEDEPDITVAGLLRPDHVPSTLRQRVLAALTGTLAQSGPLAPPEVSEVTRGLAAGGHDALAYLLPAADGLPGAAIIIRPSGEITVLAVPELAVTPSSPAGRYVSAHAAYRTRQLGGMAHQMRMTRQWDSTLRDITSWAGPALIENLLAAVGHGSGDRPARLVLVPLGILGMVPWHAALVRDGTAGDRRPALHRAVFTYAASARQFSDAVARPRRPWREAPAFVVNPLRDLAWASAEARAIRAAHCPGALLLGYLADEHASDVAPADVLALLPGTGTPGASLLHVSCHGRAAESPLKSALLLTAAQELTAERILRQARARPPGSPASLVVLAACLSDLTSDDHDEALTLTTTFLSAGAASVIGTQWEVCDARSAVLMFMTYEFLAVGNGRPADALRAAQLWMLDPARVIPPGMPADLAAAADRLTLDDPAAWAGFVHHGW
jgi:CHAT domain